MAPSQNMVSSLPFLAPVCMKKARDYRSKYSGSNGSSRGISRSRGRKNAEHYKLSDVSNDKSVFGPSSKSRSPGEEHILHHDNGTAHGHSIVKSITYTVQVDQDYTDGSADRRRRDQSSQV